MLAFKLFSAIGNFLLISIMKFPSSTQYQSAAKLKLISLLGIACLWFKREFLLAKIPLESR